MLLDAAGINWFDKWKASWFCARAREEGLPRLDNRVLRKMMELETDVVKACGGELVDAWSPTYDASNANEPRLPTDELGCHLAAAGCARGKVIAPLLALLSSNAAR